MSYDVAIVGAGIVGLAHALAATRRGLRTIVIDRDSHANGASVRNFGFVTVTGQEAGDCWRRARRSRDIWAEIAPLAGIQVLQRGLCVAAQRPEAVTVAEAFLATEMGAECRLITPAEGSQLIPNLRTADVRALLYSPHELRVESRTAIPRLAAWLEASQGVTFLRGTHVRDVTPPRLDTTSGTVDASACIVCPGEDYLSLFPERIARYGLTKCLLHMLRVQPDRPIRLATPIMSDLGLARYKGYADLPEAAPLAARLDRELPDTRANGIHLIAVQSADGSLVVGDSHHYGPTPEPFARAFVDELILAELDSVLALPGRTVSERWVGLYASAEDRLMLHDRVSNEVSIVIVTSGTGASTAFAIGEETLAEMFGKEEVHAL